MLAVPRLDAAENFENFSLTIFGDPEKPSKLFSPENGVMLCVQPLTITREPGSKYPSQHDHWLLHGELGDR